MPRLFKTSPFALLPWHEIQEYYLIISWSRIDTDNLHIKNDDLFIIKNIVLVHVLVCIHKGSSTESSGYYIIESSKHHLDNHNKKDQFNIIRNNEEARKVGETNYFYLSHFIFYLLNIYKTSFMLHVTPHYYLCIRKKNINICLTCRHYIKNKPLLPCIPPNWHTKH